MRILCVTSRLVCFVFNVTYAENPNPHRYVVENEKKDIHSLLSQTKVINDGLLCALQFHSSSDSDFENLCSREDEWKVRHHPNDLLFSSKCTAGSSSAITLSAKATPLAAFRRSSHCPPSCPTSAAFTDFFVKRFVQRPLGVASSNFASIQSRDLGFYSIFLFNSTFQRKFLSLSILPPLLEHQ